MRELRDRCALLTPWEQQVMALVVSGLLNKQAQRTLYQRDYGESAPGAGHAEGESEFSC